MNSNEDTKIIFSSELPYPPICISEKNYSYARAMLDNIGGSNSEMTAISLYIYNNMITYPYENLPMIFHKISVVEMHHLNIFGNLAKELGEDPRLWTQQGRQKKYWSPAYNKYPLQIKDLLLNAINGEKAAVKKYEQQICFIKDKNIIDILKRIIIDEKLHIEIFQKTYDSYCF